MQHTKQESSSNLVGMGMLKVKIEFPNGDTAIFLVEQNATMFDVIKKVEAKRMIKIENLTITVKMETKSISVTPEVLVSAYPTMILLVVHGKIGKRCIVI
jgi:hypothetical protein